MAEPSNDINTWVAAMSAAVTGGLSGMAAWLTARKRNTGERRTNDVRVTESIREINSSLKDMRGAVKEIRDDLRVNTRELHDRIDKLYERVGK